MCITLKIVCLVVVLGGECLALKQKVAVPAYFWPDAKGVGYWKEIEQGANVGIAIANPNSGPGTAVVPEYSKVIKAAANAGRKVIGYVDTGYFGLNDNRKTRNGDGSTSAWTQQIKSDIDKFYSFYPEIKGIFLDDGLNQCGANNVNVNLYKVIHDYIKQKHPGHLVVINPGTNADQCYLSAADVLVIFEHDYQAYLNYKAPTWSTAATSGRVWHLIYNVATQAQMEHAIELSKQRNAGYVYVTDDNLPNPWDTLPPVAYWKDELNRAGQ